MKRMFIFLLSTKINPIYNDTEINYRALTTLNFQYNVQILNPERATVHFGMHNPPPPRARFVQYPYKIKKKFDSPLKSWVYTNKRFGSPL